MRAARLLMIILAGFAAERSGSSPNPRKLLSEEHKAKLDAEIEKAGPRHPWAGRYYEGDGLGTNASLVLSPTGEYSFENWGCLGLYGSDSGMIQESSGIIRFAGAKSYELADKTFHVVPWGERVYLIQDDALVRFANEVNQGVEPRYRAHGRNFVRQRKALQTVRGLPGVPRDIKPYILDHIVDAVVIATGAVVRRSTEAAGWREFATTVELNAGRRDGMLPEMALPLRGELFGEAEIREVRERTSTAIMTSSVAPQVGWRVSTREDAYRDRAPDAAPFIIRVTTAMGAGTSPYPDNKHFLHGGDPFKGAAESGFSVHEVGRIEIAALTRSLLTYEYTKDALEERLTALGANASWTPMELFLREREGPWSSATTSIGYRIEYQGEPVGWLDFRADLSGEGIREDWPRTAAYVKMRKTKYHLEQERIREDYSAERLHWRGKPGEGWGNLRVEDLDEAQLAAFRENLGLRAESGLIHGALPLTPDKWSRELDDETWRRLKPLRDADPGVYEEYRKLHDFVYAPLYESLDKPKKK